MPRRYLKAPMPGPAHSRPPKNSPVQTASSGGATKMAILRGSIDRKFRVNHSISCARSVGGPSSRRGRQRGEQQLARSFSSRTWPHDDGIFPETPRQVFQLPRCGPADLGLRHRAQMRQVGSAAAGSARLARCHSSATVAHRLPRIIIITYDTLVASPGWP